ncbi:MAG: helix-turn-helix domain-containing protein [Novosphingobium sp.]
MQKRVQPAVDAALTPRSGFSRLGQPLSYSRAPSPDLAPWVGWLYATAVEAPADHHVDCGLLNDMASLRIQLSGQWTAQTATGPMDLGPAALHFGPQSRRMAIGVTGSFVSIGVSLRPGAATSATGRNTRDFIDRVTRLENLDFPDGLALLDLNPQADPEVWLGALEAFVRSVIERSDARAPEDITSRFELLAYADPNASVEEFARECGIGVRQFERIILRDFGLSPKQVLRRARALDMAAHFRGVADEAESEELLLRYYDQSHLIREFTHLFGMTPRQFIARPQPIMTLALETRQARRLQAIQRLQPGGARPWA